MSDDLVTVATFRFLPEAEVSRLFLEAEGFTPFLADAETINMDWLLANAVGDIKLQVPASQAEAATAALERTRQEIRETQARSPNADGNVCLACGATIPDDASRCPACGWSYNDDQEPETTG